MLASGQIALDIKRKYVNENKGHSNIPLPQSYQPEVPISHLTPKSPQGQKNEPEKTQPPTALPEDSFKHVGNTLKLNQSAMHGDKDKADMATQKLEDLADKSDSVLLKVSSVFPFTFFVNDIIIDPYKVNIIFREFFWSEHIHSIMVKDILDVVVETSLFFATIKIVDQGYVENMINIEYLKKEDALKVRKVIQGLVIAHRQAVDLSVLSKDHIKDKASELGKVKGIDDTISVSSTY